MSLILAALSILAATAVPPAPTLSAVASPTQKGERWPAPDQRLKLGPLTVDVYVSRTAHVFHLVDQLSAWDNACHGQYRRHAELSEEDEELLARHAELRQEKRWGQGLEQTFYTPLDLEDALRAGRKAGRITGDEEEVLREVLNHFTDRADALLEERRDVLLDAFGGIDEDAFTRAAKDIARFTGVKKLTVPAFPIASPEGGGGGMDGGRLRWEIESGRPSPSVFLHELTHGFFQQRNDELRDVCNRTPGLSMTMLGEGFAYAVAPGMYPFRGGDPLAHNVAQDRCGDDRWDGDTGYGEQRMFGLAVRPLLAEAFANGTTLEELLPHVRSAFLAVHEVMMAEEARPPTLHMAGPARDLVRERLRDTKYSLSMYRFNHAHEEGYERARRLGRADDLFVVLFAGDDEDWGVPDGYEDMLPADLDDVRKKVRAGRSLTLEHRVGALRVVLLAAPTTRDLERLVQSSPQLVEGA